MAVPNTNTFTMIDVCTEMGLSASGRSLAELFANANNNGFDPNYVGSKDRLSNFRNYTHADPPYVSVTPGVLNFYHDDIVQKMVTVSSNTTWFVDTAGTGTWVTVSPTSGSGDGTVSVGVSTNFSSSSRTTTFFIKSTLDNS